MVMVHGALEAAAKKGKKNNERDDPTRVKSRFLSLTPNEINSEHTHDKRGQISGTQGTHSRHSLDCFTARALGCSDPST